MITIANQAPDQRAGLTLHQLAAFVQDAMRQDLAGDSPITATLGWRGQIKTITVTDREAGPQPRLPDPFRQP